MNLKSVARRAGEHASWLVLGAGLLAACGSSETPLPAGDPQRETPVDGSMLDTPEPLAPGMLPDTATPASPTGGQSGVEGGPELRLVVAELPALPNRTTPDAIAIELRENIDHLALWAYIQAPGGEPVTGCQRADIYRIGPNAVTWPFGSTLTVPLAYAEVLPPGVYAQSVLTHTHGGGYDVAGVTSLAHFFEIIDGSLFPMTSAEYSQRVNPIMYDWNGDGYYVGSAGPTEAPALPCPEPEPYSDEASPEDEVSLVDLDSWSNVVTLQPFRWIPAFTAESGSSSPTRLEFHARNAVGERLRLSISPPFDELISDFEVSLAAREAQLSFDERGRVTWYASAGRIAVQVQSGNRLHVAFSDVVLQKSRTVTDPEEARGLEAGRITGEWILE